MLTSSIGHLCSQQGQDLNEVLLESSRTEIQMNVVSIEVTAVNVWVFAESRLREKERSGILFSC